MSARRARSLYGPGFNEAAGFTRRKHTPQRPSQSPLPSRFNEAAGFTRRKRRVQRLSVIMLSICFNEAAGFTRRKQVRQVRRDVRDYHLLQ